MQDIIIDDFAFELPLSNYDGKDFVIWGREDKISQGDVLNGELHSPLASPSSEDTFGACQVLRYACCFLMFPHETLDSDDCC